MGAETGVFQNLVASRNGLWRYRFPRCGQHHARKVRIYIVFMQAGQLQNGEELGLELLSEDGVGRLEAAGALVSRLPLKGTVQVCQQVLRGAVLEAQQNRPDGQGVAAELLQNLAVGPVAPVQGQAQVPDHRVAVLPQLFSLQATQADPEAGWKRQPLGLVLPAGEEGFRLPTPQALQQSPQKRQVLWGQLGLDLGPCNAGGGLQVVPNQKVGLLSQNSGDGFQLLLHGQRPMGRVRKLPHQLIHHVFRRVDLLEVEPEDPALESAGAAEPVQEAPGQGGLAAAGLAVDQQRRLRLALHGPLQLLGLPVAPNEAVVPQGCFLRQGRSRRLAAWLKPGEGEAVLWHLPVQHRDDPVLQRKRPRDAAPPRLPVHLTPSGPHGFGDFASPKQLPVKRRDELLSGAHIQAVAHGHHAVDPCPQEPCRHTGEGIPGLPVHHSGLAGVEHHAGNPVFGQELGQAGCLHGFRLAVFLFEQQQSLRRPILPLPGDRIAVVSVAVKVDDVIVPGAFLQRLPQTVKGGRAQNVYRHRQTALFNEMHQALRQGPVAKIRRSIRARNDIEDVEGVLGQVLRQRRRIPQVTGKLPLNGEAQGQIAVLPAV